MKRIFTFLAIIAAFSSFKQGTAIDEVMAGLKSGNAAQVAKYFDNTVDLTLPGKSSSNTYSKSQAEQVLKDFFAANGVKGFDVIHKGDNGGNQYCIGTLTTRNGAFRTTLYMKQREGQPVLPELKIEGR
jgi:hypothetical protein